MTPKPSYSCLSTKRDGHQSGCHRKGSIVPGKTSIQNLKSLGPSFGEHDMHPSSLASKNRNSVSDLGNTYSPPSGYKYQTTFAQQFLAGLLISVQMK